MPLFVKIDFRTDGKLGAWWTRETYASGEPDWSKTTTRVAETRIRKVFAALADEIDPERSHKKKIEEGK